MSRKRELREKNGENLEKCHANVGCVKKNTENPEKCHTNESCETKIGENPEKCHANVGCVKKIRRTRKSVTQTRVTRQNEETHEKIDHETASRGQKK